MFKFTGGVGFGMNIGDFLEFKGTFQGNRIMPTAPEKERILLHGEMLGPVADLRLEFEHFADSHRQMAQRLQFSDLNLGHQSPTQLGKDQRQ